MEVSKIEIEASKNIKPSSKKLNIVKLFPNIITLTAICLGLSSIKFALDNKWSEAVMLIITAGFLDVVDGRLARFLKATSNFGAYLDSLADFVDFGIAPAIVVYLWHFRMLENQSLGWGLVLFYAICMAVRLARFNSDLDDESRQQWQDAFFKGVPAPIGAYLIMIPMMLSFRFEINISDYNLLFYVYFIIIALLTVSTIPTFSTKKTTINREYVPIFFVGFGLMITAVIIEPWLILSLLGLVYICMMPFSYLSYRKHLLASDSSQ